eukprot:COSAG02_NODE_553_length_20425_cov_17.986372_9_plen_452_part_00
MSFAAGDAARQEDGTLGVVCYGPDSDGDVRLLLEDGSTTDWINPSALARPSEAELAAAPWLAECWAAWVKVGAAVRREDGTLGVVCDVVCYGPYSNGDVKLLLEDGSTTGYIKASALARPSEAELAAAPWTVECWAAWVKVGEAVRRQEDGTLGVVRHGPNHNGKVKLLLEDGSTTGWIEPSALARPSEAELAAAPWTAECWVHWMKVGACLRGREEAVAARAQAAQKELVKQFEQAQAAQSEQRERGMADEAMPPGTRLHFEGHLVPWEGDVGGAYVRFERNTFGANSHFVRFDESGTVRAVQLKKLAAHAWRLGGAKAEDFQSYALHYFKIENLNTGVKKMLEAVRASFSLLFLPCLLSRRTSLVPVLCRPSSISHTTGPCGLFAGPHREKKGVLVLTGQIWRCGGQIWRCSRCGRCWRRFRIWSGRCWSLSAQFGRPKWRSWMSRRRW